MGKKCLCGGGGDGSVCGPTTSQPIAPTDVLDVLPLVKHVASMGGKSFVPFSFGGNTGASGTSLHVLLSNARTAYELGHASSGAGKAANMAVGLDCAQEAASMK